MDSEGKDDGSGTSSDRPIGETPNRRRSRPPISFAWVGLLLVPIVLLSFVHWAGAFGVTKSQEHESYYFRLQAHYTHMGEPIDFDIVVACDIRVDHYRGGDSGFLASRYPRFFVKMTRDNHAVMQIVPIACRGETTENGIVPGDFLPGAIWFDKPGDYRFGIAYVSEDAFESPNSQLKFRDATIRKASRAEWEVFVKQASDNEGMRSRYYDRPSYWTEDAQRIAKGGGKEIEAAYARGCRGVIRYRLSEAARAFVRKYWPADKPKFWSTAGQKVNAMKDLIALEREAPIFTDGIRFIRHLNWGNYQYGGFPTRNGGGMMWSHSRRIVPADIYPSRFDRGIPWVFTDEVAKSQYLTGDVEVRTGPGKGFLYCYTNLNPGEGKLEIPIPNFRSRESRVRVDGEWVVTPSPRYWSWPRYFFEGDQYMYTQFGVSLS